MSKKPLAIIFLTVFIDLVGFGIIIPLSPFLAREYGADALEIGWLMAIYSGMQFLFAPVWGRLSDRIGRRPIILMSLLGASLAHLLFAFASELWVLFLARGLAGLFAANISTAMAYIADVTEEKDRSKGMGLIGAAFGLGFVLGPFLGALFGAWGGMLGSLPPFGNQFAAVGAFFICFVNFVSAIKFLPESLAKDLRGQAKRRGSRFSRIFHHIQLPVVGRLMVVFFALTLAMAFIENQLFLYVQDRFSWGMVKASYGFAYVGIIMVITQGYLIRKWLPKFGERRLLVVGLMGVTLGFLGIGLSSGIATLAVVVTSLGLGIGLANPSITGSISLLAAKTEQGEVLGVNQSLSALGRVIGPPLGGWLYRDFGMTSPFFAAAGVTVFAFMLVASIFAKLPEAGQAAEAKGEA